MATAISDWFMRGTIAASIVHNDSVWSDQAYQMDREERLRTTLQSTPCLPDDSDLLHVARDWPSTHIEEANDLLRCPDVCTVMLHEEYDGDQRNLVRTANANSM